MGLIKRIFGGGSRAPEKRGDVALAAGDPRDPAIAQWLGVWGQSASGVSVTPETARQCPEVDACIGLIEDTVATLPLDLFERTGTDGERVKRDDLPLYALVHDRPNAWQSSAEFRQMMEGWRLTHGNAYAEIVSDRTGPVALEPLYPRQVRPYRLSSGDIAYEYTPNSGGGSRILLPGEMLHLRDHPFSRDMMRGESRVERHKEAIGRALATGEYLSRFFSNGAVPKTFLVFPPGTSLTEDQRKEAREQFERRHAGLENAHRIGMLQGGLDVKTIGVDNEKAQVVEAYGLAVSQIARIYGVPPHLVGDVTGSTSWGTGIEQQSIGFVVYCMRPKLVVWEQGLTSALMSRDMSRRFFFEFNADGLLRGDFKSRMDGYAIMIQWGLATPNEVRRRENLPPLEGGDERLTPLNMVPASRIMDVLLKPSAATPGAAARSLSADEATAALIDIIAQAKAAPRRLELIQ